MKLVIKNPQDEVIFTTPVATTYPMPTLVGTDSPKLPVLNYMLPNIVSTVIFNDLTTRQQAIHFADQFEINSSHLKQDTMNHCDDCEIMEHHQPMIHPTPFPFPPGMGMNAVNNNNLLYEMNGARYYQHNLRLPYEKVEDLAKIEDIKVLTVDGDYTISIVIVNTQG